MDVEVNVVGATLNSVSILIENPEPEEGNENEPPEEE